MSVKSAEAWVYHRPTDNKNSADAWKKETKALPPLNDGELLVETLLVSVDPYIRIQQSVHETWQPPYEEGTDQLSYALCRVIESKAPAVPVGKVVRTYTGWVTHAVIPAADADVLDDALIEKVGLPQQLYALGMVGRTAWYGVNGILVPKSGQTALVSGAAGATGSLVVQLFKEHGCRVIATAGSDEKCELLKSIGADVAINYKATPLNYKNTEALRSAAPNGIDLFFDNVGGDVFDAAIQLMNTHGRIAICGQISQYNNGLDEPEVGPRFLHRLIYKRIHIIGFLQRDASPEQKEAHQKQFIEWLQNGKLKAPLSILEGFDKLPEAQLGLFEGKNTGKMLVQVKA